MKVDLIRASWLANPVGPSRTLNRIINNKDYFALRGFEVNVFTMDMLQKRDVVSFRNSNTTWKYKIKTLAKAIAKNIPFLLGKIVERECFLYGKQIVEYYINLRREADIIVFHDFFSCYYYHLANSSHQAKTVLFYHNNGAAFDALLYYYPRLKGSSYLEKLLDREKMVIDKTDKLVFIARYGQRNFLSIYPEYDANKTITIHNGIDDAPLKPKNNQNEVPYRLICSGTINQRKGQYLILQAMSELPKELLSKIHLTLVGSGSMREELEDYAKKNNLTNNVSFTGAIDNREVEDYLAKSNIYILMSFEEGLPISIIEALRAGLGIIATRISGIPELIDVERNGLLLDPDKDQLVEILKSLPKFDWSKFGDESRKKFEKAFTFENMREKYCDMLDSL